MKFFSSLSILFIVLNLKVQWQIRAQVGFDMICFALFGICDVSFKICEFQIAFYINDGLKALTRLICEQTTLLETKKLHCFLVDKFSVLSH